MAHHRILFSLRSALATAFLGLLLVVHLTPAQAETVTAEFSALDKITARITTIEAPIGRPVQFGTLEILVRSCSKRPPEEPPETTAFVEIKELRPGDNPIHLFTGWMFASSPGLNALEHPVYDVWLTNCTAVGPSTADGN